MGRSILLGEGVKDPGPLGLDVDKLLGIHSGVIANNGAGKSGLIRVEAEGLLEAGVQTIFLDPEDEFYTLREKASLLVLGGTNGDAPATPRNAAALALTLLKTGMSAVIQLNSLQVYEQQEFVALFLEAVMSAPQELWHPVVFVLDEAHRFAPQDGRVASSLPVEDLVSRGRKRGFSAIISTQRMAKVDKNVTGEITLWFMGRVGQATDRKVMADALGFTPGSPEGRGLQTLEPRTFWALGYPVGGGPNLFRVTDAQTTMVKAGQAKVPTPPAPAAMAGMLAALVEAAKPPPPPPPPQAAATASEAAPDAPTVDVEAIRAEGHAEGRRSGHQEGYERGHADALGKVLKRFPDFLKEMSIFGAEVSNFVVVTPAPVPAPKPQPPLGAVFVAKPSAPTPSGDKLPGPVAKVAAFYDSIWPKAVAFDLAAKHAGVGLRSSLYRTYEPALKESGRVEVMPDGRLRAQAPADVRAAAGGTGKLLDVYAEKLSPAYARIMAIFREHPGQMFNAAQLLEGAGLSPTSSSAGGAIRELTDLDVIEPAATKGYFQLAEMFR